jgi:KDO2-lipid IV(A) lauroyltransferase
MKLPLKRLRHAVGEAAINAIEITLTRMPLRVIRAVMDTLFFFCYPVFTLTPIFRKTVMKNLKIAFGNDLPDREIRRIARGCIRNILHMPGDILHYGYPENLDNLRRDVKIAGVEHLDDAFKKGKGIIGLGAHMTGFLLLTVRLANSDIPFVVPTKDPRNEMLMKKLRGWRDVSGVRYINVDSADKGKQEITDCLANNELVYLIADERKKRDGVLAPFFGKDALTAVGPAALSLKTGAPIVPIFIARRDGSFVIDILPPLNGHADGPQPSVFEMTCRANRVIEDYIRKYPDQWVWIQKRWRR